MVMCTRPEERFAQVEAVIQRDNPFSIRHNDLLHQKSVRPGICYGCLAKMNGGGRDSPLSEGHMFLPVQKSNF